MRSLMKYLKGYKKECVLGPLFKLLEASFELIVPLVMAQIIDVGIKARDKNYLIKMGLVLLILGVIGLVCSLVAQYYAAKAAVGFGTKLRKEMLHHINDFSYTELDQLGTATLITRMTSDINQLQSGVNLVLRLFLRSPFVVFGAMIMAFTISWRAAMVFVITIPILAIIVFVIMFISMPLYKRVQKLIDQVLLATRENLVGVRVIRAFNRQEDEIKRFEQENTLLLQAQVFVGKISALMNPVTYVVINGAIVVLLWTGSLQVNVGTITQGEVIALVSYMSQILVELIKLANLIITISKSFASASRIQAVFDKQSSMIEQSKDMEEKSQSDWHVDFNHVNFCYAGSQEPALKQLNIQIKRGQTIGIIGGTGSGKTSLINLIPRFYDATEGVIKINGIDVKEYPIQILRDKVGLVPQKAVLFYGSIRDNIKWGDEDASDEEIWEALETAQAKDFVMDKDGQLSYQLNQGGKNLSGGQRQRLTIARALVRKPEILILDDSSSALDYATDAKLRKAMKEFSKEMTVFIISQRASSLKIADQIVVLDEGLMVGCGSHDYLMKECQVYQEICLSQLSKEEVTVS